MLSNIANIKNLFGILLMLTSVLDAIKYTLQANKIHREKSSRTMSRKFINFALLNDIVKLIYGIVILDIYISLTSLMSLICMLHLWWEIYLWYPYRNRNLMHFKRPSLMLYTINSILPNRIRKHL